MTAPDTPISAVHLVAAKPQDGCATCGTQQTVQLHPYRGRQCSDHITLPPGGFRADLAADMVDVGRVDAAWNYLRAWLVAEGVRRFGEVAP